MTSDSSRPASPTVSPARVRLVTMPLFALLVLAAAPFEKTSAGTALWAAPAILAAAMLIAWAAESAQFFIAQGFALAILAWLQTLPEFAVEFVLAWKQRVDLLLAGLTGALRLLTGLGWPMIYFVAAFFYRRNHHQPLRCIRLQEGHAVEVVSLFVPLVYMIFVWFKSSLNVFDAAVLIAMYVAYLLVLRRLPAEELENVDELEFVPRTILKSRPAVRASLIIGFFAAGGILIYLSAEPFLGSLLAISAILGIPTFVFVQWVAPLVSEFPEKVSAFYWARTVDRAPMALMNMVSSNVNQWTLLTAMLPIVYSISKGAVSPIPLDGQQELELLMTIAQSVLAMVFLLDMKLTWKEATALFTLWAVQFGFSPVKPGPGLAGYVAQHIHHWITGVYVVWCAAAIVRLFLRRKMPAAFHLFGRIWNQYIRPGAVAQPWE